MLEAGEKITLRDGQTQVVVQTSAMDEIGNLKITYLDEKGVTRRASYAPGETLEKEGEAISVPPKPQAEPEALTVQITATDIQAAFKEGFKMALGMDMMVQSLFGALGLDKEKVNQAIAQTGQIAVEAKAQLDRIEANQNRILEILTKAQAEHDGTKLGTLEAAKE